MNIKIAGRIKTSVVNGEGTRYTIFFQGCDMNPKCSGCHAPHTWDISNGITVEVEELLDEIESVKRFIDGVSISGGNPTMQLPQLQFLLKELKKREYNVWMWTGHPFEKLKQFNILDDLDVVIDGVFDQTKPTEKEYRGSDNQKMWKKEGTWINVD